MIPSILTPAERDLRTQTPRHALERRDPAALSISQRDPRPAAQITPTLLTQTPLPAAKELDLRSDLPAEHSADLWGANALPTRAHRLLAMLSAARIQRRKSGTVEGANRPTARAFLPDAATVPDMREVVAVLDASPRGPAPQPAMPEARLDRDLHIQIKGIQEFIGRLECEIATRHGQRAERAITLKALRREVSDIEIALDEAGGAQWINLVEQYNAVKTRLTQLAEIDKRQTEIDISDEPHMEAELQKWRLRLAHVVPHGRLH